MRRGALIAVSVFLLVVVVVGAWFGLSYTLARGTGPVISQERDVASFATVDLSGEGRLLITSGKSPGLWIEAQQNILDRLESEVSGDTLRIRERWGWFGPATLWANEPITYHVTVPNLKGIKLAGAIVVQGEDPIEAEELLVEFSGSCDIELEVQTGSLVVNTSGDSDVDLRGRADRAVFGTSGLTEITALDLASRTVTINCSGSSDIEVNASEHLKVTASGSSIVSYVGDPAVDKDISGSGEVRQLEQ